MYLDNYAGHMRNFTGSVDCWGFLGGGGGAGSNHFITEKNNDVGGAGCLA